MKAYNMHKEKKQKKKKRQWNAAACFLFLGKVRTEAKQL